MTVEELLRRARRNLWWLGPLVLILVNLVLLSTYRSLYSGRVSGLGSAVEEELELLERLEAQEAALAAKVERSREALEGIDFLYSEVFAPESARFTEVVRELRRLASRAGVVPERIAYPEELLVDYGLIERSFVFSVDGDYDELRRFVNFLELSSSFLILESLGLTETDEGLRIRIVVSTLFSGRDDESAVEELES